MFGHEQEVPREVAVASLVPRKPVGWADGASETTVMTVAVSPAGCAGVCWVQPSRAVSRSFVRHGS